VALSYVVGFMVLLAVMGWHPELKLKKGNAVPVPEAPLLAPSVVPADLPVPVVKP
jgi:hypothetical protein